MRGMVVRGVVRPDVVGQGMVKRGDVRRAKAWLGAQRNGVVEGGSSEPPFPLEGRCSQF